MAREGVSYDQVAKTADELLGDGQQPTIRLIRDRLGTGSPNTIHRHLTLWRDARPQATAAMPELPATLAAQIAAEISRAAAQARAEIEGRLIQAQAEAAELAATGETLETERDSLIEQVAALTRDRDTLAGKAAQQAADLAEQATRLDREQHAAEAARIEVATARLKIEAQAEKQNELTQENNRLRTALETSQQARQTAEQEAAVLAAKFEAMTERANKAESRADRAEKQAQQSGEESAELAAKFEAMTDRAEKAEARADKAEKEASHSGEEAAELRGRLNAAAVEIQTPDRKPETGQTTKKAKPQPLGAEPKG